MPLSPPVIIDDVVRARWIVLPRPAANLSFSSPLAYNTFFSGTGAYRCLLATPYQLTLFHTTQIHAYMHFLSVYLLQRTHICYFRLHIYRFLPRTVHICTFRHIYPVTAHICANYPQTHMRLYIDVFTLIACYVHRQQSQRTTYDPTFITWPICGPDDRRWELSLSCAIGSGVRQRCYAWRGAHSSLCSAYMR